jgi:CheY-like chemotaxis protein
MTTVLLLEDNVDMLKVLGTMLEETGYHVLYGRDAREGLNLIESGAGQPDVIISDMVMPSVDGLSLLAHIRNLPGLESIPFILMSGLASPEMQQEAFKFGADAFLVKPFPFATLNNVIRNLGLEASANV